MLGWPPDTASYDAILAACSRAKQWQEVHEKGGRLSTAIKPPKTIKKAHLQKTPQNMIISRVQICSFGHILSIGSFWVSDF